MQSSSTLENKSSLHRFHSALDIAYAGILSGNKQLDIRHWADNNKRNKSGFLHPTQYLNNSSSELFRGAALIRTCDIQFNFVQQPNCELLFGGSCNLSFWYLDYPLLTHQHIEGIVEYTSELDDQFHGELYDQFGNSLGKQYCDTSPGNKQLNHPLDEQLVHHFHHFDDHFYCIIYYQYINIGYGHIKHVEHIEHLEYVKHGEHFDIHDFNLHRFDYTDHVDTKYGNDSDHVYFHLGSSNYCNYSDHHDHSYPSDDSEYSDYSEGSYNSHHSDHFHHSHYCSYFNYSDYHIHSDYSDHSPHYDSSNHSDNSDHFNVDHVDHLDYLDHVDHLDHLHYFNVNPSSRLSNRWPTVQLPANGLPLNALGYNARDDYLYAVAQNGLLTSISIIRLNARGDVSVVVPQVANKLALLGGFNAGDVDENSQYWISTSGNDWYQYDLRPGSATYAQQIAYGTLPLLSRPTQVIADWAYVPGGGNFLWAIGTAAGGRTVLMQFSRSTKRWTQVRDFGNIVGGTLLNQPVWGAVYASANGFLYGTENLTGQVWRFPVLSSTAPATSLVTGSPATLNDGARCLEASNLPT
ncbi:hypothetical protein ACHAPH_003399 [Verticillium nonalfalfae]